MRVFHWSDEIVEHIAEHGITPEDVEDVFDSILWTEPSRRSGLPTVVGLSAGRLIRCVYRRLSEIDIEIVTAYEMDW